MSESATLELHFINVGQGDSILIVNRDLEKLKAVIVTGGAPASIPANPIDHLPYAIQKGLNLCDTVRKAVLIDAGDDQYGDDVVAYLESHGVLNATELKDKNNGYAPNLDVVISHFHDDHMAGLLSLFTKWTAKVKDGKISRKLTEHYWPKRVYLTGPDKKEDPKRSVRLNAVRKCIDEAVTRSPGTERIYVQPGGVVAHDAPVDDDPAPAGLASGGGSPGDSAGSKIEEEKQTSPLGASASGQSGFETLKQLIIPLGKGINEIPITLTAYAASRAVYDDSNGDKCKKVPSATLRPDQNDRSIMFVLQYGSFRAYLGGDLAGDGGTKGGNATDLETKSFFSMHTNVEKDLNEALVKYLPRTKPDDVPKGQPKFTVPGYCTVLKANHHASSSSVDVHTLATTRPCIAFVPAGVKARFHRHPTQQVLDRMSKTKTPHWEVQGTGSMEEEGPASKVDNTLQCIYLSEIAREYKRKPYNVTLPEEAQIVGDVIVRPVDETVAAIQLTSELGQEKLTVQVYATGDQTVVEEEVEGWVSLRPSNRQANDETHWYRIGPDPYICNLH
jgi:beta-lactamase superfamily II metal-dependent hydrolase